MKGCGVEYLSTKDALHPSSINRDWIISGDPRVNAAVISTSADGQSFTAIWECTAGTFHWHYAFDETLHFLEGSVTLDDGSGPRTVGAGDVVYFPKGSSAVWHVETYIRKLAICRKVLPAPIGATISLLRSLKAVLRGPKDELPPAGVTPQLNTGSIVNLGPRP
jgi:uncharacterized cupin superfamily protein